MAAPCASGAVTQDAPETQDAQVPFAPANPRPLMALGSRDCRFPLNSKPRNGPGEYLFCGDPVRDAKTSYCPHHCGIVFWRASGSPQRFPINIPVDRVDVTPEAAPEPVVAEVMAEVA